MKEKAAEFDGGTFKLEKLTLKYWLGILELFHIE
jgi:hypothetical protein